jgi:hypothetical protein
MLLPQRSINHHYKVKIAEDDNPENLKYGGWVMEITPTPETTQWALLQENEDAIKSFNYAAVEFADGTAVYVGQTIIFKNGEFTINRCARPVILSPDWKSFAPVYLHGNWKHAVSNS